MINSVYTPLKEDSNGTCKFEAMRANIVRSIFFKFKIFIDFIPNKKISNFQKN